MTTRWERTTRAGLMLVLALATGAYGCAVSDGEDPSASRAGALEADATVLRGASHAANASSASLVLARPAGTEAGDVMLAAIAVRGAPAISPPSGWSLVRHDASVTVVVQAVYLHVASASEPATYAWRLSSSQAAAGAMLAYGGVDAANPVVATSGQAHARGLAIVAPSLDSTAPSARLVGFFGIADPTTIAPPSGMTARTDADSTVGSYQVALASADGLLAAAGESGTRTAEAVKAGVNVGQLVALRAATAVAPGTDAAVGAHDASTVDARAVDASARDATVTDAARADVVVVGHDAGSTDAGASGPTRYLATTGADSNPGTAAAPWRTFAAALPRLRAGDTLLVRAGTYVEDTTGLSLAAGSAGAPITVRAYPGERAVHAGLFWLDAPTYWTLDGLAITWNAATDTSDQHMVKLNGGVGWRVTNAEIYGAHSWANVLISGEPTGWSVDHCVIHDNYGSPSHNGAQDHNLYIHMDYSGTASSGRLERNLIYNASLGEDIKCDGTGDGAGGCMGVTFDYNTLATSSRSFLLGGQTHDSVFHHNLVVTGSVGSRIAIYDYNLTGANNVFHDNLFQDYGTFLQISGSGAIGDVANLKDTVDPRLDANHCPLNAAAAAYGHCAP